MPSLCVFVEGIPVQQPRIKAAIRGGKVHVYTPSDAKTWKKQVTLAILKSPDFTQVDSGPITMSCNFILPRPAGHYDPIGNLRSQYRDSTYCYVKPDLDNLLKAVMDAISESGLWHDDSQVQIITTSKHYPHATSIQTGVGLVISW